MRAPGGRPLRRWYLLQLAASTDTKTAPVDPLIILEGNGSSGSRILPQPPFLEAITKIAASKQLSYVIWGIDPATMPPTRAVKTEFAPQLGKFSQDDVLSQESWSKTPQYFEAELSRPKGRRDAHHNVRLPQEDSTDGVFFFVYDATLYVWPKARMDDGVIRMLHVARLIDDKRYTAFVTEGYKQFDEVTATSGNPR